MPVSAHDTDRRFGSTFPAELLISPSDGSGIINRFLRTDYLLDQ